MCRALCDGGRRCPGRSSGHEKHNARRRHNRRVRRQIREFLEARGGTEERELLDRIEQLPIDQAKQEMARIFGIPEDQMRLGAEVSRLRLPTSAAAASSYASSGSYDDESRVGSNWSSPKVDHGVAMLQSSQNERAEERALLELEVSEVQHVSGGTNITRRVIFEDGSVAYHKSFSGLAEGLASSFGHDEAYQPLHEVAAYRVAHELGEPYASMVPATVLREVDGELGSLQAGITGGDPPYGPIDQHRGWAAAGFFDALIGQQDRHGGNVLVENGGYKLIDHGYSFSRPADYQNAAEFQMARAIKAPDLTAAERSLLRRVIDDPTVLGLRGVLPDDRVDALVHRARRMHLTGQIYEADRMRAEWNQRRKNMEQFEARIAIARHRARLDNGGL